jgi:RNA polymerase sigma factor (sigma-70 family)
MITAGNETEAATLRQSLAMHHGAAWTWAMSCCDRNRADAEDVLHTTYLKILDGRACFDGRSSALTWILAVVRRTAIELRRRRYVRALLLQSYPLEHVSSTSDANADCELEATQLQKCLLSALAALARRQREVLTLVFYHDLTVDQAAHVMGISSGAARRHYARGKDLLRKRLGTQSPHL